MAKSKASGQTSGETSSSRNALVSIPDVLRGLRTLLHDGYTHIEFRDSIAHHPVEGAETLKELIHPIDR